MNRFVPAIDPYTVPIGRGLGVDADNVLSGGLTFRPLSGADLSPTWNTMSPAQTALAMAARTAYANPLWVGYDVPVVALKAHVTTAVAGAEFELALYAGGADGWPTGTPIANTSTISGSTSGVKSEAISETLQAGRMYWLVVGTGNTACTVRAMSSGTGRVLRSVGNSSVQHSRLFWFHVLGTWRDFTASPVVSANVTSGHVPMAYLEVA